MCNRFFKMSKNADRLGEKWRRSLGLTSSGRLWRFMADGAWFIGTGGPGRTDRWCTFRWRRPQREFHAQRRRNDRQQRHRQGKCRAMQIFLIMQNDGHFQKKCYFLFVWIFFLIQKFRLANGQIQTASALFRPSSSDFRPFQSTRRTAHTVSPLTWQVTSNWNYENG